MIKPSFLTVGAAKSGTTSIFEYLRKYPDIYLPRGKEIGYFSSDLPNRKELKTFEEYLSFFSSARKNQVVGEVATAYLYSKVAAENIFKQLGPNTKIIIILRNPVDMIYSLWRQNTRDGGEALSFKDAIFAAQDRLVDKSFRENLDGWIGNYAYLERGEYFSQVERYVRLFGQEKVKIFVFEEFFKNVEQSMREVYEFVGVDLDYLQKDYKVHNPSSTVHSSLLHTFYTKKSIFSKIARTFIPPKIRASVLMYLYTLNTKEKSFPDIDKGFKVELEALFKEDVIKLEDLTGLKLGEYWF